MGPPLQVSAGKSTVLRPGSAVTRVVLGDPTGSGAAVPKEGSAKDERDNGTQLDQRQRPGVGAIDVLLLSPTEVYVLGKAVGTTNLVLLEQSGRCTAVDVVVTMDTGALQGIIGQLLPQEKDVRITAAFDSLVLSGSVSDSTAVSRVMELANAYVRGAGGGTAASVTGANPRIVNMLSTGAPQQVMLEVKVAEVSKSVLDQFGIDFSRAYAAGDGSMIRFLSGILGGGPAVLGQLSGTGPSGVPLSSVDAVVGGAIPSGIGSAGNVTRELTSVNGMLVPKYTTTFGTVPARGVTNAIVNAQKTDGLIKVLAEPTVMAISGQKGSFLAGGKIFIPVAQDSGSGGRTVTLEEKEFGVSVNFLPTVLDGSRINLEVASEVSELNRDGIGIAAPGISGLAILPSFTSRRAKTTVQLLDGQSFAIGGLIKNNTTSSVRAFPFLGEIPVLGALFRSTEFQSDKSELVFVITPRLVKPLPPNYALPTDNYVPPSRTDLHVMGRLEGRRQEPAADANEATPAPAQPEPATGGFQVK
jgi:pilus assembly protein CpaC